ncbi:MAG: hypothetical protein ACKVOK_03780 [Flavobacteriales bacterium]
MQGLYYAIERGEYTKLHLLRFYNESQYVIAKSITGDDPLYIRRELANFKMEGHVVKGEPEYTFCGAFDENGERVSFKVENEIRDSSNSWAHKDVLSFKGTQNTEGDLALTQVSKRTKLEVKRTYHKTTDEEVMQKMAEQ